MNKKLLFLFMILVFSLGYWQGYRTVKYLARKGCYDLAADVTRIDIVPESTSKTRFIALGDVGTGSTYQKEVADGVKRICEARGCDFVLLLGDNFMNEGVASLDDPHFRRTFETIYADIDIPFVAVIGNHDAKGNVLAQVSYDLKNKKWKMPNFSYCFEAGPTRFFAMNTNCNIFSWIPLDDQLPEDPTKWIIVYGHHPVYSSGVHGDNEFHVRWFWQAFLQERTDFYLSGHNHLLEHLQYPDDETEYVISGAGGSHYRSASNRAKIKQSVANSRFLHLENGFVWMQFQETRAEVVYYDSKAVPIYQFSKQKS